MFDNQGNQRQQAAPPASTKIVRFDKAYLHTAPGVLKLIQLLCNIIGFICIKFSSQFVSAIFFNILYWVGIIITLFLFLMYLFHFVEKFDQWPWHKCEFFYCVGITLIYIGCSIFALTIEGVGYAVGFFGLCAIIAYGFDGYLKYRGWRSGLPPQ